MRMSRLWYLLAAFCCLTPGAEAQDRAHAVPDLHEFLPRYLQGVQPLDKLYAELADENLSMRDERGQALARRHIEDRQRALDDLRNTAQQLASTPQDLVLAIRLFLQSEALSDDLFDQSQIAYDNNREELGKRFADLQSVMDHHNASLETYVLSLAADRQDHMRELERENQDLRQKLREALEHAKAPASHSP